MPKYDFNKVALETVIVKTVLILMKNLQGQNMNIKVSSFS